jgi:hypothetical protein
MSCEIGCCSYLDPRLGESYSERELLPHEDVRVVRLAKVALQLTQLSGTEAGAVTL